MVYPECPKCGAAGPIDEECPQCGIYVSKFLDVQRRRAEQGLAPVPGAAPPIAPPPRDTGRTRTILVALAAVAVLGGIGYVVLIDWFGDGFAFSPPPGWQRLDDETVERAMSGMCPSARERTTIHALYTLPAEGGANRVVLALMESEDVLPGGEGLLKALEPGFSRVERGTGGAGTVRTEAISYGGHPGAEVRIDVRAGDTSQTVLLAAVPFERCTMFAIAVAPTPVMDAQAQPIRSALGTMEPRPQGLRAAPWFKYGLRWTWVLAVLIAAWVLLARLRNR
jgi:hypothetical protein